MGAFHEGHVSLFRRRACGGGHRRRIALRQPCAVRGGQRPERLPARRSADATVAEAEGVDLLFAPGVEEMYPPGFQTWVDVEQLGASLEGVHRPGHFRGVATICLKLFNIVRPQRAYFGQKDAQQVAGAQANDPRPRPGARASRAADGARRRRARVLARATHGSPRRSASAPALSTARSRRRTRNERATLLRDLDVDYVEVADFDAAPSSPAPVRVGNTRLIDNVILEGDTE